MANLDVFVFSSSSARYLLISILLTFSCLKFNSLEASEQWRSKVLDLTASDLIGNEICLLGWRGMWRYGCREDAISIFNSLANAHRVSVGLSITWLFHLILRFPVLTTATGGPNFQNNWRYQCEDFFFFFVGELASVLVFRFDFRFDFGFGFGFEYGFRFLFFSFLFFFGIGFDFSLVLVRIE
jgi:hypothetical protein